jgi:hypothetical protein
MNLTAYAGRIYIIHSRQFMVFFVFIPMDALVYYGIVPATDTAHEVYVRINEDSASFHLQRFVFTLFVAEIFDGTVVKYNFTEKSEMARDVIP